MFLNFLLHFQWYDHDLKLYLFLLHPFFLLHCFIFSLFRSSTDAKDTSNNLLIVYFRLNMACECPPVLKLCQSLTKKKLCQSKVRNNKYLELHYLYMWYLQICYFHGLCSKMWVNEKIKNQSLYCSVFLNYFCLLQTCNLKLKEEEENMSNQTKVSMRYVLS